MIGRAAAIVAVALAVALVVAPLCGCGRPEGSPARDGEAAPETPPEGAGKVPEVLFVPDYPASAQNPAFSPKGDKVLFTLFHSAYNHGPAGLYLLDLESGAIRALLDEADHDSVNLPGSCWNAATGRIVFSSDREEGEEIWTMDEEGGGLFRVTRHGPGFSRIEPSFSPDGQWVVFEVVGGEGGGQGRHGIWKVRIDGTGLTALRGDPASGSDDRQPNWSPAGDRILFQSRSSGGGDWDICTMSVDGGDVRRVTGAPSEDTDASWSPDGRLIVYSSDYGGLPNPEIFVIPAEGGTPVRLTFAEDYYKGAPSFSPDGRYVAFEARLSRDEGSPTVIMRVRVPESMRVP
ncbi:MAG: hypothetical protein HPY75_15015 [Actinobacteria bacterium]|nr:hypothetical protein [Actinomycetota bacterium]